MRLEIQNKLYSVHEWFLTRCLSLLKSPQKYEQTRQEVKQIIYLVIVVDHHLGFDQDLGRLDPQLQLRPLRVGYGRSRGVEHENPSWLT